MFYEKLGYQPIGEVYYDEWCPHITMSKNIWLKLNKGDIEYYEK